LDLIGFNDKEHRQFMAALDYRVMDTQIFNLKLSIYATSAYIVFCDMTQSGVPPTIEAALSRWVEEPGKFHEALTELLAWQIVEKRTNQDGDIIYLTNPASLWRLPGSDPE
jgi:hypothetical protein